MYMMCSDFFSPTLLYFLHTHPAPTPLYKFSPYLLVLVMFTVPQRLSRASVLPRICSWLSPVDSHAGIQVNMLPPHLSESVANSNWWFPCVPSLLQLLGRPKFILCLKVWYTMHLSEYKLNIFEEWSSSFKYKVQGDKWV